MEELARTPGRWFDERSLRRPISTAAVDTAAKPESGSQNHATWRKMCVVFSVRVSCIWIIFNLMKLTT